jgi:hypothetical protein
LRQARGRLLLADSDLRRPPDNRTLSPESQESARAAAAAQVLLDFLARRVRGETLEFERFCAERGAAGVECHRRYAAHREIVEALVLRGESPPLAERLAARFGEVDPQVSLDAAPKETPSGRGAQATLSEQPGAPAARLLRGGGFYNPASYARSARRFSDSPEYRTIILGVRPAWVITE